MVKCFRIIILGLCITSIITFRAAAQQPPPSVNPNHEEFHRLMLEIEGLHKQLQPLRTQLQQLMEQVNTVREQMRTIQEKMKADQDQMRSLSGASSR